MDALTFAQAVTAVGLIVAVVGLARRWQDTVRRPWPVDGAVAKGDPAHGVRYAFTSGMAPAAKESTRIHLVAYLRGVGFHLAIFAGLLMLFSRPAWPMLPPAVRYLAAIGLAAGALLGAAGSIMRLYEPHLRALSTADDHLAVWLVTVFLTLTGLTMWQERFAVPMYLAAGVMLAYVPAGKIRHCVYFFFARASFGRFVGRRGVLPHPKPRAARGLP